MHQQAQQPFEMTQRKTKKEDDSALHHLFLMTASSKDTCCPCFTSLPTCGIINTVPLWRH